MLKKSPIKLHLVRNDPNYEAKEYILLWIFSGLQNYGWFFFSSWFLSGYSKFSVMNMLLKLGGKKKKYIYIYIYMAKKKNPSFYKISR